MDERQRHSDDNRYRDGVDDPAPQMSLSPHEAPDDADDRVRYLATGASVILARKKLEIYNAVRLTLSLNESMQAKTQALKEAELMSHAFNKMLIAARMPSHPPLQSRGMV